MAPWLFATGLITLLAQVVLLREILVSLGGAELLYVFALGIWLLFSAFGTTLGRRVAHRARRAGSPVPIRLCFLGAAFLLPFLIVLLRSARSAILHAVPGTTLPLGQALLLSAGSVLPMALVSGWLFQAIVAFGTGARPIRRREGNAVSPDVAFGPAYAVESAGGLVAGALSTCFVAWGVSNWSAALLAGLGAVLAAALPFGAEDRGSARWPSPLLRVVCMATAAGLGILLAFSSRVDFSMTSWTHPPLAATVDTAFGRVSVEQREGEVAVFGNDALVFGTRGVDAEILAQLPALSAPRTNAVLVLGGGLQGLVDEASKLRPLILDHVEPDGALLDVALPLLPPERRQALERAPVRNVIADPRRFLSRPMEGVVRYDLVLIGLPPPENAQANRFYTRDFFSLCRARLADDGVLALALPGAENYWTSDLVARSASVVLALESALGHTLVLPGDPLLVLASPSSLPRDPEILKARLTERGLATGASGDRPLRLVTGPYLVARYTDDRVDEFASRIDACRSWVPINSDDQPTAAWYSAKLWLSRLLPSLGRGRVGPPVRGDLVVGLLSASLALASILLRRRRPSALVLFAGLLGMVLEGVLLLAWQVHRGVLFGDLGLLLVAFMSGLSLGAWCLSRPRTRRALFRGESVPQDRERSVTRVLLLAFAFLAGAVTLQLRAGLDPGLAFSLVELAATGSATGTLVSLASISISGREGTGNSVAAANLYALDLLGGCLGSLLGSLLLLPLVGLSGTAAFTALAAVLVAAFL
jgi:spermidine synthase